jgi:hypothetical protein
MSGMNPGPISEATAKNVGAKHLHRKDCEGVEVPERERVPGDEDENEKVAQRMKAYLSG